MEQKVIIEQFDELRTIYTELTLQKKDHTWIIQGFLNFNANFSNQQIEDKYLIEIKIPDSYPSCLPIAFEVGNRIAANYHKFIDGSLCLGEPLAVRKTFFRQPTLLGFVNNCLIPYLYSYSFFREKGVLPYGELSHGEQGKIEYYRDFFDVQSQQSLFGLISILAEEKYRGHIQCPCESKKRIRSCHGPQILEIMRFAPKGYFQSLYQFMSQRGATYIL